MGESDLQTSSNSTDPFTSFLGVLPGSDMEEITEFKASYCIRPTPGGLTTSGSGSFICKVHACVLHYNVYNVQSVLKQVSEQVRATQGYLDKKDPSQEVAHTLYM